MRAALTSCLNCTGAVNWYRTTTTGSSTIIANDISFVSNTVGGNFGGAIYGRTSSFLMNTMASIKASLVVALLL
jgi:predicted outer membrane repeat protein